MDLGALMSHGDRSDSGVAVAPAREMVKAKTRSSQKWWHRLFVLAGLLIYFGSFLLTAAKQSGDRFGGFFCAYYTLVWPWTDGLDQRHSHLVTFVSMMLSGWVNPTFLLICLMPPVVQLKTFVKWVLKPLWVVFALSCWVVFFAERMTPVWGYYLWTLSMVMVLFRERLLATLFRTDQPKTV